MALSPAHVPSIVHSIAQVMDPWKSAYSNSKLLGVIVMFAHIGALLLGGGFAVAADRSTLRALRMGQEARLRQLTELHAVHRPVLIALGVLFVSGLLMAAADVETFAVSPAFWVKITCVTLLVINGGVLYKTEEALQRGALAGGAGMENKGEALWGRLRMVSITSLVLWTATALAGTVLSIAA